MSSIFNELQEAAFVPHDIFNLENSLPAIVDPDEYKRASYAYEIIMDRIRDFEEDLDDDHELGLKLAAFGTTVTLAVTDIGYSNPNVLVFHGLVDGKRATLIQHMTQLNFLLVAVPKNDPEKPPRRIGFALPDED